MLIGLGHKTYKEGHLRIVLYISKNRQFSLLIDISSKIEAFSVKLSLCNYFFKIKWVQFSLMTWDLL